MVEHARLVCILGAGASVAAGVPDFAAAWQRIDQAFGLTDQRNDPVQGASGRALRAMYSACERLRTTRDRHNLEALCAILRKGSQEIIESALPHTGGGAREKLEEARGRIEAEYAIRREFVGLIDVDFDRGEQAQAVRRDYAQLFELDPGGRIDLFSLNNDLLTEWVAAREKFTLAAGFGLDNALAAPGWAPYRASSALRRLFKLHGSIDWYREPDRRIVRWVSPSSLAGVLRRKSSASIVPHMPLVWPGVYDEMPEVQQLLREFLHPALQAARAVLVIGYKMGDASIANAVVRGLAAGNPAGKCVFVVCGPTYDRRLLRFIAQIRDVGLRVVCAHAAYPQSAGFFPRVLGDARFRGDLARVLDGGEA